MSDPTPNQDLPPVGEDITPEGSVAPVYLDTTPLAPVEEFAEPDAPDPAAQASAVAKLQALGFTDDEIRAIARTVVLPTPVVNPLTP